jgi:hypothetical protein
MKVIVMRAGLAGLTCAKVMGEPGAEVALFEASDCGSWRTDEKDGFLLGRDIPYGRLAGPTGIQGRLPEKRTATPGLVLAGGVSEA